jgi:hypothetical protein
MAVRPWKISRKWITSELDGQSILPGIAINGHECQPVEHNKNAAHM